MLSGCAEVTNRKVPTMTQYVYWTDDMQREADEMEGFRYYLPRPFLNVFESFPVRTDVFIADGVVSPDGKYVIIKSIRSESELAKHIAGVEAGVTIDKRVIHRPTAKDVERVVKAQAGEEEARAEAAKTIAPTGVTGVTKPATAAPAAAAPVLSGVTTQHVRNDNSAFAFQPLRGNFDIVYMPDFEEQYVVSGSAGLGTATFSLNLGQGWSLQGLDSLSDNSALNARIFDLVDTSMRLAKAAAPAALGLPISPETAAAVSKVITPQAGEEDAVKGIPGTPVSLKIVVVHYAAKGLYPVIKPRELAERTIGEEKYHLGIDIFKWFELARWYSKKDARALQNAQIALENPAKNATVPRYPYQYVSFNTFRYLAVEVVKTDAPPFGTLYDKTGTTGDPGDRQTVDQSSVILRGAARQPTRTVVEPPVEPSNLELALEEIANSIGPGMTFNVVGSTSIYKIENKPTVDDDKLLVNLTATPKPSKPPAHEELGKGLLTVTDVAEAVQDNISRDTDKFLKDNIRFKLDGVDVPVVSEEKEEKPTREDVQTAVLPPPMTVDEIKEVQRKVCLQGNDVDGVVGPLTRRMVGAYQRHTGQTDTGKVTPELLQKLRAVSAADTAQQCAQLRLDLLASNLREVPPFKMSGATISVTSVAQDLATNSVTAKIKIDGTPSAQLNDDVLVALLLEKSGGFDRGFTSDNVKIER